jgi:uncharacterized membrane protein (DUF2068 family)
MTPESMDSTLLPAHNGSHHKTLFMVLGVLFLLGGAYFTVVFCMFTIAGHGMAFRAGNAGMIGEILMLAQGLLGLAGGFGLLTRKSWGHFAALAAAVLFLFNLVATIPALVILILLFTTGSKKHYASYCGLTI